jgi:hypothetical protein
MMLCVCFVPFGLSAQDGVNDGMSENALAVELFGLGGELTPQPFGQPLPDAFFTTAPTRALALGANYTAVLDLVDPHRRAVSVLNKNSDISTMDWDHAYDRQELFLTLGNPGDWDADILVSAAHTDHGNVRNFIVRVPAGEEVVLDMAAVAGYDALYLISATNFAAARESLQNKQWRDAGEIRVLAPRIGEASDKATNYCSGGWYVSKRIINDTNGSYVTGYFERTGPYQAGSRTHYGVQVHYPSIGTVFHLEGGTSAYTSHPACKMLSQTTWQVSTYKHLKWSNKYNYWDGVDEVWFNGATGKAVCSSNCAGDTTTWTIQ